MRLVPLGDQAVLAYFEAEADAVRFAGAVRAAAPAWLLDVVPAYAAVGVHFDLGRADPDGVAAELSRLAVADGPVESPRSHVIPCCYDLGPDLARVAELTGRTPAEVVGLHAGRDYTVHAVGFCPGFPYLGYLPPELAGVPRLPSPRLRVEPGSVGLTGRQTGLYPLPRPGGWNLVGRTPLVVVDVAAGYFPIRVGDSVRFRPIDAAEYRRLEGERL